MSFTPDPIAFHVRLDHERSIDRYDRHLLQRLPGSGSSSSNERPGSKPSQVEAHKGLACTRYLAQADAERQQYMWRKSPDVCRAQLDDQWQLGYGSSDCCSDADKVSAEPKVNGVARQVARRSRVPAPRAWERRVPLSYLSPYEPPSESKCLTWLLSMTEQYVQRRQLQDASTDSRGASRGLFAEIHDSSTKSPTFANTSSGHSSPEPGLSHAKIPLIRGWRPHYTTKSQAHHEQSSAMEPKTALKLSRGESLLVLNIRKPRVTAGVTRGQVRASSYGQNMEGKIDISGQVRYLQGEKRYQCTQCNRRFKNKNEAVRHHNSLHIRRQSWSCARLPTCHLAFYPNALSDTSKTTSDTCGFCGQDFSNQPVDWNERTDHLIRVHKFGQCYRDKKFFRADHFRQHLQHGHGAMSGKWSNVLQKTCESEEAPHGYPPSINSVGKVFGTDSTARRVEVDYHLENAS